MHEQHRVKTEGYSLVEDDAGVPVLHIVLDQLSPLSYKQMLRSGYGVLDDGGCKHHDHVDPLVNDNIHERRGNK